MANELPCQAAQLEQHPCVRPSRQPGVKVALAHQGGRTIWHVIRDQLSPLACARQPNSYADSKYTPHLAAQLEDADQHSRPGYPGRRWTLL